MRHRLRQVSAWVVALVFAGAVVTLAQVFVFDDGTVGTKTALFSQAGTEIGTALSTLAAAVTSNLVQVNVSQVGGSAPTAAMTADFDTSGSTQTREMVGVAVPANGGAVAQLIDPCSYLAKSFQAVNTNAATTIEINEAVASAHYHVCSVNLVTAAANNVTIAEDDTQDCASPSAGVTGGTTAATGWNFGANGGIAIGNGASSIARTTTVNRRLCVLTSAATQISGSIGYVSAIP